LIALIYGRTNPLLDHAMVPGHSMVTAAVFENPIYHVLTDLLGRKRVQVGTLDLAAARARFTMTVGEAAERLGVNATAVRKAIAARRLVAWKDGPAWWLDPTTVDSFQLARRGLPPRLEVRMGNAPGVALRVKYPGDLEGEDRPAANTVAGTITHWKRVAVLTSMERDDGEKGQRLFILEPGGKESEVKAGDFYVRGRFTTKKVNSSERAREQWKEFEPE
jgi:excisionase family DNA binding protein